MWKRIVCAALTAILCCGLFAGCAGEKKPEVTLRVKLPVFPIDTVEGLGDASDMYTVLANAAADFAEQYTEADVTINVSQYEVARKTEEIEGCFDTERAADVLWGMLESYIFSGRAVSLDDIITDEIRSDISGNHWERCMVEGKTYILPFFSSQVVMCYNKELFRQAGLEQYITDDDVIQSWTLEEWDTILDTLRAQLPSAVYPVMMYAGDSDGDMHTMVLLRRYGSGFFDEDGLVDLNTPEGIEALNWIREGNEKGYFPPHAENLVMLDCYELFLNDQLAIYCANVALQTVYEKEGIDYGLVNLASPDGKGYNTTTMTGFSVMDNGDELKVKTAKAFLKYIYESQWLEYSAGGIPVSDRVAEKYKDQLHNVAKYIKNAENTVNYTGNNPNWNGVRAVFYPHIQDVLLGEKPVEQIAEEIDTDCNAAIEEGRRQSVLHD